MDIKKIQELVKLVNKTNIGEISIEEKDFKITIRQKEEPVINYSQGPVQYAPQPVQVQQSTLPQAPSQIEAEALKEEKLLTIKSPMIGTFYRQAGPGKPMFANVGDEVTAGKVVCIIEAMKLFNEIESEISGTIVKILVEDASPVEFDQPLFLVQP